MKSKIDAILRRFKKYKKTWFRGPKIHLGQKDFVSHTTSVFLQKVFGPILRLPDTLLPFFTSVLIPYPLPFNQEFLQSAEGSSLSTLQGTSSLEPGSPEWVMFTSNNCLYHTFTLIVSKLEVMISILNSLRGCPQKSKIEFWGRPHKSK